MKKIRRGLKNLEEWRKQKSEKEREEVKIYKMQKGKKRKWREVKMRKEIEWRRKLR